MTQQQIIEELQQRMSSMELEIQELKAERPRRRLGNPWARICGMLANEPLYDDWRKSMEEYRDEVDKAAQS